MTYDSARFWVLAYSLGLTGLLLPFFFLAPVIGYPLDNDQAKQALSLLLPFFLAIWVRVLFSSSIRLPAH